MASFAQSHLAGGRREMQRETELSTNGGIYAMICRTICDEVLCESSKLDYP